MGRLEYGVSGDIVDISAGCDADAPDLGRERIAQVIAVQIWCRDYIKILWSRQDLLESDICNGILNHKTGARFAHRDLTPWSAIDFFRAEVLLGNFVAPIAERAFGKLHDVTFVHHRHAFPLESDCIANCAVNQTDAARAANGFDADPDLDIVLFGGADFF